MGNDTCMTVFPDSFEPNMTFPYEFFNVEDLHTVDEGTGSDENTLVAEDWRAKHKKSSSNSTILSANNVPYLLAKLEEGAEDAEGEGNVPSRPVSVGSTAEQIKEEFYQKQSEEEMVDWGASHTTLPLHAWR